MCFSNASLFVSPLCMVCLPLYAWFVSLSMHDLSLLARPFFAEDFCRLVYAGSGSWLEPILCHNEGMGFCVFRRSGACRLPSETIWLWLHTFLLSFVDCKEPMHNAQPLLWSLWQRTEAGSRAKERSCSLAKRSKNTGAAIQY